MMVLRFCRSMEPYSFCCFHYVVRVICSIVGGRVCVGPWSKSSLPCCAMEMELPNHIIEYNSPTILIKLVTASLTQHTNLGRINKQRTLYIVSIPMTGKATKAVAPITLLEAASYHWQLCIVSQDASVKKQP